ncbi:MAG TPA: apolipoprotein N-acyltransferase [Vicinamibacterales bacterium]
MDYALAVLSGALLALSFPKFGHPAIGWIALAPLLVALASARTMLRAFALGLVAGGIYFTGTLYWITRVMMVYGGLQVWVAVLVNAALIAYLALFPAVFAMVMRRLLAASGRTAMLAAPFVWTATELGRTHLFTGFPWVLLGYSQVTVLPIAQLASLVGVFGVSALVAATSASLAFAATDVASGFSRTFTVARWTPYLPFATVAAIIVVVAGWGSIRVKRSELTRQGDVVRIGLVQGNVEQSEREDAARQPAIFQSYLRMTRQAIGEGAELVLWPESSTPFYFEEDRPGADQVRRLARQAHVPILLGSDQIDWGTKNGQRVPTKYYNSAFLVRADGTTAGFYRKMHLVPFGEYVPLKQLFFFAAPLVQAVSDFSPGESAALLEVKVGRSPTTADAEATHLMSTAICYEIVYPDLVRQFVVAGSELLSTITNDAWFGKTSAPYQHFAQASMRAIEEGRYLVRSANTGISGMVDPYGRVLIETRLYESAVVVGEVRFLTAATVYSRLGDVFAYASVVLTLALLIVARRRVQ